ncbi:MAG: hypothetical protein U5K37_04525 [Natrialbaceae archaeon]|nr:hypothetical protein [Natrialbaceae archaeon]
MNWRDLGRPLASGAFIGILIVTILLTAAFVGFVALTGGATTGVADRIHYYILGLAAVFVTALWQLDDRDHDGGVILVAATSIAVVAATILGLAAEGFYYAMRDPGQALQTELLVYFIAAALICTGLGIWAVRHWREFADENSAE